MVAGISEPEVNLVTLLLDIEQRLREGFRRDLRETERRLNGARERAWSEHARVHDQEGLECDERMAPLVNVGRVERGIVWVWANWKQVGVIVGGVLAILAFAKANGWRLWF